MKTETTAEPHPRRPHDTGLFKRMLEAMGTVYGDIGTSVLYTVMELTRETVRLKHNVHDHAELTKVIQRGGQLITPSEALGQLSLIYWALIFLTVKYDVLVMRADNRGEGGTFALWGLLKGYTGKILGFTLVGYLVVAAVGLLAADSVITPPISMLGAYEPLGESWAIVATLVSLFVLFKAQWRGTSRIGGFFGWFMMALWFPWIAIKGIPWIIRHPEVFLAFNPLLALQFLAQFPSVGAFVILGVVILAITGGEAKYADIGHFTRRGDHEIPEGSSIDPRDSGRRPVMYSWLGIVMPCLMLNYAGQIARILEHGVPARGNTYYSLTPRTGITTLDSLLLSLDMVISGIAAFIASQALISGLFSIVKQGIALGFCPRFNVQFTSRETEGQVYIPAVNWAMFAGCVAITLTFRTASSLVAAYGIAVTGTMAVTTFVFAYVAYYRWKWPLWKTLAVCIPILVIDLVFFLANLLKLASGGYFPVSIAVGLMAIMLTWQWGRSKLAHAFYDFGVRGGKRIEWLVALREKVDEINMSIEANLPLARTLIQGRRRLVESDRAFVFLCSRPIRDTQEYVPVTTRIFLKKFGVLPAHVTFFHAKQISLAEAKLADRFEVFDLGRNIVSVIGTYGYMEQPDIRGALRELQGRGKINIPSERCIITVGEEEIITSATLAPLAWLKVAFFRFILHLSTPAHRFLGLGYDAGVSKEIIPVVFSRAGVEVTLPELEISEAATTTFIEPATI